VINRIDGSNLLLKVCQRRPERSDDEFARLTYALERNGLGLLEREASEIKRQPLFSNARSVWDQQDYHVSLENRLRLSVALEEYGPQSILTLRKRAHPDCNIFLALYAMACENLVELDVYSARLGWGTVVRSH
jgi:hypothetical protein